MTSALSLSKKTAALRNAGGVVMETFKEDTDRLYGELLRLCRQVVQVPSKVCILKANPGEP